MSGFVSDFDITFNQFLIDDGQPMLIIHTGPVGNTGQIEQAWLRLDMVYPMYGSCFDSSLFHRYVCRRIDEE